MKKPLRQMFDENDIEIREIEAIERRDWNFLLKCLGVLAGCVVAGYVAGVITMW